MSRYRLATLLVLTCLGHCSQAQAGLFEQRGRALSGPDRMTVLRHQFNSLHQEKCYDHPCTPLVVLSFAALFIIVVVAATASRRHPIPMVFPPSQCSSDAVVGVCFPELRESARCRSARTSYRSENVVTRGAA